MTLFECRFRRIIEFGRGPPSVSGVKRSLPLKLTRCLMASALVVAMIAGRASAEGAPTRPCASGDLDVYACVEHPPAWPPGQRWVKMIGHPVQVGNIEISLGAAVFTDGSTWGNPHRLAQLKSRRGNCEWPGS
jgi:hypothetical protein